MKFKIIDNPDSIDGTWGHISCTIRATKRGLEKTAKGILYWSTYEYDLQYPIYKACMKAIGAECRSAVFKEITGGDYDDG